MPAPRGKRDIEALLRASGYTEEWHIRRLVETATLVPPAEPAGRLVDVGTHPAVLNVLAQVGAYEHAEGVDHDDAGPDGWTVRLPVWWGEGTRSYRIHNRDLQRDRLPFDDESVDLVTALETLEHLLDPMHMLIEVNRILRAGGALLLTTPNVVSWQSARRLAARKSPFVFPLLIPGRSVNRHNIEYTPGVARALLAAAGFEGTVETRAWWYRVGLLAKARLVLAGFWPGERGDVIVARMRKRSAPVLRYPPEAYQLEAEHRARNHDTTLEYRGR